jgi:hypothetical protein
MPWALLALAIGLTLVSGMIHGRLTQRFSPSDAVAAAAARLSELPAVAGPWRRQEIQPLGDEVVEMLQCAGYISQTYVHEGTGATVRMALLLGPPGPISVHTPEVCYSSKDYTIENERQRVRIRAKQKPDEELWQMTFRHNDVRGERMSVAYAWNDGSGWSAPSQPRFTYGGRPYLYKLQLAGQLPANADDMRDDPCRQFLAEFLPVADQYLVQP